MRLGPKPLRELFQRCFEGAVYDFEKHVQLGEELAARDALSKTYMTLDPKSDDPAVWTERYHCPTWGDYLRMRDRYSQDDLVIQAQANIFDRGGQGPRVRRRLERPFGSVRWNADSPDPLQETIGYIAP